MDMLEIVMVEIIICLVIAWILGFVTAWILKKSPNKNLEEKIVELKEDLKLKSTYCRGLEKENAHQETLLREYREEDYSRAVLQKDTNE